MVKVTGEVSCVNNRCVEGVVVVGIGVCCGSFGFVRQAKGGKL